MYSLERRLNKGCFGGTLIMAVRLAQLPHLARLASLLTTNLYWVMHTECDSFIYGAQTAKSSAGITPE